MRFDLGLLINLAAIVVMAWCFYSMVRLSPKIPGGVVGKTWRLLQWLVGLFLLGYLLTPFFPQLPPELINLLVALIFLFGAIYVLVTVRLIYRIITVLSS
jgi:hypothetical protein